ncbi:MAG: SGNH/GDSL hydrolase family protein, partial [Planctomycetota bacterium]
TWKKFGGTHPAPFGNALCTGMIDKLLKKAWAEPIAAGARKVAHPLPDEPLDKLNYERGRFVDPAKAAVRSGWRLGVPEWKKLKGSKRGRFTNIAMLSADEPGSELELEFEGTAVGAYVVAGPDAGTLEASVDGGETRAVNLFHRFSRGLHYPRTVMFATDLGPGPHTLRLRVSTKTRSSGNAARIMQFVVN